MPERVLAELHELNGNLHGIREDLKTERDDRRKQIFWTRLVGIVFLSAIAIFVTFLAIDKNNEETAACIRGNESRVAQNNVVSAIQDTDEVLQFILDYFDNQVTQPETQDAIDQADLLLSEAKESASSAIRELRIC